MISAAAMGYHPGMCIEVNSKRVTLPSPERLAELKAEAKHDEARARAQERQQRKRQRQEENHATVE